MIIIVREIYKQFIEQNSSYKNSFLLLSLSHKSLLSLNKG